MHFRVSEAEAHRVDFVMPTQFTQTPCSCDSPCLPLSPMLQLYEAKFVNSTMLDEEWLLCIRTLEITGYFMLARRGDIVFVYIFVNSCSFTMLAHGKDAMQKPHSFQGGLALWKTSKRGTIAIPDDLVYAHIITFGIVNNLYMFYNTRDRHEP